MNTAPTSLQANSVMWTYSSISGTDIDINTGLIGPVIITLTDQTNSTTGLPQGKSVCLSDFLLTSFDQEWTESLFCYSHLSTKIAPLI